MSMSCRDGGLGDGVGALVGVLVGALVGVLVGALVRTRRKGPSQARKKLKMRDTVAERQGLCFNTGAGVLGGGWGLTPPKGSV